MCHEITILKGKFTSSIVETVILWIIRQLLNVRWIARFYVNNQRILVNRKFPTADKSVYRSAK